ncbi:TMV resistance protein N-like [Morus notabilis]|uniref:TMV resistance protein N-like n=1 Tax=Morus notabilis TaxID=981085 RepID=UPI000CED4DD3|nr:TMV resistance protein N-like [Morus notabilis]
MEIEEQRRRGWVSVSAAGVGDGWVAWARGVVGGGVWHQVAKRAFILFVDMDDYGVSPSSPSSICEKYDVFLSFRGADTRHNFISHLFAALTRKQIKTYIDEESLEKGDDINIALPKAIQKSKIAIIIFSKDYASSTWCLRELERILECHRENKQMVITIFYEVYPSDIREQKESYEKPFIEHENRFKDKMKMVNNWRVALAESADLSGWVSRVTRTIFE